MARSFSSQDVRDIIAVHEQFINALRLAANAADRIAKGVSTNAERLISQNAFVDPAWDGIVNGIEAEEVSAQFKPLIFGIDSYIECKPKSEYAKSLLKEYEGRIMNDLAALTPAKSDLRWMFSFGSTKDKAAAAYSELESLLQGNYAQQVQDAVDSISNIESTSEEIRLERFLADKEAFGETMDSLAPGLNLRGSAIREVRRLLESFSGLFRMLERTKDATSSLKEDVKSKVDRVAAEDVMKLLQNIPVDELNRDKAGIRVKTLRDAGYSTVADVILATEYQLEMVNGVSRDSAKQIKDIARDFMEEAKSGVHIKLNSDERTQPTEALVSSLFTLKQKVQAEREVDAFKRVHEKKLNSAVSALSRIGNGMVWLFYGDTRKTQLRAQYDYLSGLSTGEETAPAMAAAETLLAPPQKGTSEEVWADFNANSIEYYNLLEEIIPGILGDDAVYGLPEDLAREIQDECIFPNGLLCTLRRYQEWGVKYILHQERVLLGDEMGLGKTVQAIGAMVSLKNTGASHFLVVCPASVITNWCREVGKHSKLRVVKIHGSSREAALQDWLTYGGVGVTTYETTGFFTFPEDFRFCMTVVDEAHYIKNASAKRTQNVKKICKRCDRLLFMTGTALENNVDEMIALIEILKPDVANQIKNMAFMATAPQFRDKVAPVYYRRRREDVLQELPELIESKEWCDLLPEEERLYEAAILGGNRAEARRVSWNVPDLQNSSKAQRLLEILEEAENDGRKVLVFSFFLDTIRKIYALLGDRCMQPINGSVAPERRQQIIDEFNEAPAGSVLLAQIQAGGTGLNIQAASIVVICEPQFKPSIENQAIARAYRMGQARNVLVYRLLCDDTIDERIMDILENKQAIFDAFADKSTAGEESLELDEKTFGDIIQEEIERINEKYKGEEGKANAVSEEVTQEMMEEASEEEPQEAAEEASEEVTQEVTENASEDGTAQNP